MAMIKFDLCIIGAGSGGLSVAAGARAFGASVVLIEKDKMGGDCLNVGCVPSKAFIAAAKKAHAYQGAKTFGITYEKPKVDFARVQAHVADVIASIAPHDSVERFEGLGVKVIKGTGRFIDEKTVEVGGMKIKARRFVIATGSRPASLAIAGLQDISYFTNENIFELKTLPKHLIIIGGGPIGMELAQAFNRLGAKVSVIEKFNALAKDDKELAKIALQNIRSEGVEVFEETDIEKIEQRNDEIVVFVDIGKKKKITGTHLLVAAGRAPNIEQLGLENANVKFDKKGIKTNTGLCTSNKKIFAIGDVTHGLQFTHVAGHQASLAVKKTIFGLPIKYTQQVMPWVTYCDPEIANVGLSEKQAKEKFGKNIQIVRSEFIDNDRAKAMRNTKGLVKLILHKNGNILGAGIVGSNAGELISLFSYAIANGQKVSSLVKFIAPYPTLSEIARRVGVESYRDKLSNPWIKRWTKFISLLP